MASKSLLVGLLNCKNLGDRIIFRCSENLLKQLGSDEYTSLDLELKIPFLKRLRRKILQKLLPNDKFLFLQIKIFEDIYYNYVKGVRKIIFVGGGIIKFKYQLFWAQISAIINIADKEGIPVYFNAVGVEGYDEKNKKCQLLKAALNKPCVKLITVRDDIDLLKEKYINIDNKTVVAYKVSDPAVFTKDVFHITKQRNSNKIGIGLVRGEIFKDNELTFSKEQLIGLYIDLINILKEKQIQFELFINGFDKDLELYKDICVSCALNEKSIRIPKDEDEFVSILSGYSFVIAARLHACIVSYSLDIPAIGFVWNNKLKMFGQNIGHPDRFISIDNLNANYVFNLYEKERLVQFNQNEKQKYMETQINSIRDIIK